MKKKKISFVDILSIMVFIPESSIGIVDFIRIFLKKAFRIVGKIATIFF